MKMLQNEEIKFTTNYWGCRELTATELLAVGGGDDSDGGGDGRNDDGGESRAGLGCDVAGAFAAAGMVSGGVTGLAALLTGLLVREGCNRLFAGNTGDGGGDA